MKKSAAILLFVLAMAVVRVSVFAKAAQGQSTPILTEGTVSLPSKNKVWVFILAGQSNMAGRAVVESQDTITNNRIITINSDGNLLLAKEPLHFYEPDMMGLDCGISFAEKLLQNIPDSIVLLLIPAAVGGSSINQWLGDSLHRKVRLLSNLQQKIDIGKSHGIIKGILWHQGESDANKNGIVAYGENVKRLFQLIRGRAGNLTLPVITGRIGLFGKDTVYQNAINKAIYYLMKSDENIQVIQTGDFKHKGDSLHFDSPSQRLMGSRMAAAFLRLNNISKNH